MSKRRKGNAWSRAFRKERGRPQVQRSKLRNIEKLEERHMLNGDPIFAEVISSQQAAAQLVDAAFRREANLSQYSGSQLEDATRWVVVTDGSITQTNFSVSTGLIRASTFEPIANTFFAYAGNKSSSQIIASLSANPGVEHFYPEVAREIVKRDLPNDTYIRDQWHLRSTGQQLSRTNEVDAFTVWGADARLEEAWAITTGGERHHRGGRRRRKRNSSRPGCQRRLVVEFRL